VAQRKAGPDPTVARSGRGRPALLVTALGWVVLAPVAAVALARLVAWDSRSVLVGLNALTPVLYLPAWAVAVVAGAFRRWALLGAALVLVVAHVGFELPEVLAASDVAPAVGSAPHLRVFDANVFAGNSDAGGYAQEIGRSNPDVVVLQESTPAFLAALDATGALDGLTYRVTVPRSDPAAAAVVSRWPLTEDDIVSVRGRPILVRATVDFAGRPVRLFAFHSIAPVGGGRQEWAADLQALGTAVVAEPRPVLVAGDFNATWGNRSFRRLLGLGLTDAAAARGQPFSMTWPRNRDVVPPLVRIDHLLTSPALVVVRIGTGSGRGSDHRPLLADVALLPG
jgi:endonuclease/exonuclease/phosphatase (EEP) superfamily protein YafD